MTEAELSGSRLFEQIRPPSGTLPARARLRSDAPEITLDGDWAFRCTPTADADHDPADAGRAWPTIPVPAHWQLQGHGTPWYTNYQYPFPVDPPHVPTANPTGHYRRTFDLPESWADGRVILRFDGVDSWFELWVNGTRVGDASGSRLSTEFDITDHARVGENLLAVRVHQWSQGSYLEDQDQWWLSGIFRSVDLLHRPTGGLHDLFVHCDYDAETTSGSLRVDGPDGAVVTLPELGIVSATNSQVTVPGVSPWSAESPRLYEAIVQNDAETVSLQVGFRRVRVVGHEFQINGRAVTLRGVNRHDFDPTRGRAITREVMEADVRAMKSHNINAVRTSHYPPDPYLLDLCDRLGLYVVEECDLETHGFSLIDWRGNPSDDARWSDVYLDRMRRMVERDKNHASVIMWSLGNEAGWGENLARNARWTRERDPGRPIHYEQDADCLEVDVFSRMYATHDELEQIGLGREPALDDAARDARRRGLPMLQCEYAHAMGNGPGGLRDYDDIIDAHPRLLGGFVWEWYDHGLSVPGGEHQWAYGGDFGEPRHDGSFVIDGLLFPDRTPSPGLVELAAVFEPIRIDLVDDVVRVRNRYDFTSTQNIDMHWALLADGEEIDRGLLPVPELAPGESVDAALPRLPQPADAEQVLFVAARLREPTPALPAGHVVGHAERVHSAGSGAPSWARSATVTTHADGFRLGEARFDPSGRLRGLGGLEITTAVFDAWRAPTENDRLAGLDETSSALDRWRHLGLDRLVERIDSVHADGDALTVSSRVAGSATDAGFTVTSTWSADERTVRLDLDVTVLAPQGSVLPRAGLTLGIRESDAPGRAVEWYGSGPGESYPDSITAVRLARHRQSVQDMQTPYVVPQENGHRSGVRFAELALTDGRLRVVGATPFGLTVRPWSTEDLARAGHLDDLVPGDTVWLYLDLGTNGVGSAACGPGVLPADRFTPTSARLTLFFTFLTAESA